MKIETAKLEGAALDWAVAKCEGHEAAVSASGLICIHRHNVTDYFDPSTNWGWGGPIIEREKMDIQWTGRDNCRAAIDWLDEKFYESFGPTPLIAAMRCYVASKLGAVVEVPDELVR